MPKGRITYQNWIVEIGVDPAQINRSDWNNSNQKDNEAVIQAVRFALTRLTEEEQEFIRCFYFQGQSYLKISKKLGRRISRIEGLHRRAINKLKKHLAGFVKKEFGVKTDIGRDCLICQSPFKDEINELIKAKKDNETWKKIIKELKTNFGISIKTPQILIGHKKYHMN